MRTILARHLTGDHTEREIEVLNAAKLGQWRTGKLEAVIHYANKTVLSIYWDDSGTLDAWAIRKGDAALHVRVPDLPAPIPDDARSTPAEERAREGSWARSRVAEPVSDFERRMRALAADLPACPHPGCNAAAGAPCVLSGDRTIRPPHTSREAAI